MPTPAILWEYIEFPRRFPWPFYLSKTIGRGQYELVRNNTYCLLTETRLSMYSISLPSSPSISIPFSFYLYFPPRPRALGFEQRHRLSDLILQTFEEFRPTKGSAQGRRDSLTHTYAYNHTHSDCSISPSVALSLVQPCRVFSGRNSLNTLHLCSLVARLWLTAMDN